MPNNLVPMLSKLQLLLRGRLKENTTLYSKGEVVITEADVTAAITEAGLRVSPILSDLLVAAPMTSAEEISVQTGYTPNA
jgi:hypothetical protein